MDYCTQQTNKETFQRNLKQLLEWSEKNEVTDEQAEKAYRLKLFTMTGSEQS